MATTNRIKELREKKGIRLVHLAAEFDVDQSTAYRWETYGPPRDLIPELARYLEAEPAYLMGWSERQAA